MAVAQHRDLPDGRATFRARAAAMAGIAVVILLLVAGCSAPPAGTPSPPTGNAGPTTPVACRVLDAGFAPVAGAWCRYEWAAGTGDGAKLAPGNASLAAGPEGIARHDVPANATLRLTASAAGLAAKSAIVLADLPKTVTFTLPAGDGSSTVLPEGLPVPATAVARLWRSPVTLATGAGDEPIVYVDSKGTVYYTTTASVAGLPPQGTSPENRGLWRSDDGGRTFGNIAPPLTRAPPAPASDTALAIAPDDSVWYSRFLGYPGSTIGCTSTDRGEMWTCDNFAIPGVTDRMWIVGLSAVEGYVQTGFGFLQPQWAHTTTGSLKYVPYATSPYPMQHGNMVYDAKNDAVWQLSTDYQVTQGGDNLALIRVDAGGGVLTPRTIDVPAPYAIGMMAVHDGVLWTTGERRADDGSRLVVAARSTDQGQTWLQFPVMASPRSGVFSYVAPGPEGRVAVVYYGSDRTGPSTNNGGNWSIYVAETADGLGDHPTWVETRIVALAHTGNLCIGLGCERNGGDPQARNVGDNIGIAMDGEGNAHVAYVVEVPRPDGSGSDWEDRYQRQAAPG